MSDARSEPDSAGSDEPMRNRDEDRLSGLSAVFVWPLIVLVRIYQRLISPLLPPTCRFYPSCSAYGLTALRRFGPIKGTWLTMKRLSRCHPWNPGGVDHVPPKKSASSAAHAHLSGEPTSMSHR